MTKTRQDFFKDATTIPTKTMLYSQTITIDENWVAYRSGDSANSLSCYFVYIQHPALSMEVSELAAPGYLLQLPGYGVALSDSDSTILWKWNSKTLKLDNKEILSTKKYGRWLDSFISPDAKKLFFKFDNWSVTNHVDPLAKIYCYDLSTKQIQAYADDSPYTISEPFRCYGLRKTRLSPKSNKLTYLVDQGSRKYYIIHFNQNNFEQCWNFSGTLIKSFYVSNNQKYLAVLSIYSHNTLEIYDTSANKTSFDPKSVKPIWKETIFACDTRDHERHIRWTSEGHFIFYDNNGLHIIDPEALPKEKNILIKVQEFTLAAVQDYKGSFAKFAEEYNEKEKTPKTLVLADSYINGFTLLPDNSIIVTNGKSNENVKIMQFKDLLQSQTTALSIKLDDKKNAPITTEKAHSSPNSPNSSDWTHVNPSSPSSAMSASPSNLFATNKVATSDSNGKISPTTDDWVEVNVNANLKANS